MTETLRPTYFDAVYAASTDPWSFETSPYEAAKYDDTIAALGGRRYRRGFEIGCSIGVLTARLAPFADHLLAVDVSEAALARARERCAGLGQVELRRLQVPDTFPPGPFDLVVMSEVGYYWSAADLEKALDLITAALMPGGTLLLVHWTPFVADYPLTGDAVHEAALRRAEAGGPFEHCDGGRREQYRLDRFEKRQETAAVTRAAASATR